MGLNLSQLDPATRAKVKAQLPKAERGAKRGNSDPEFELQCALMQWRDLNIPRLPALRWLFATFNGIRVNIGLAVKMKRMGNVKGIADVILPVARRGYHALCIELKAPGEKYKQRKEQSEFEAFCKGEGVLYLLADDLQTMTDKIEWYLAEERA